MELLWCATARCQHQLPQSSFSTGSNAVTASRDLGMMLTLVCSHTSSELSLAVLPFYANCAVSDDQSHHLFSRLRSLLTMLDYDNATLASLPANVLNRLQSVLNASAGFCCSAHVPRSESSSNCRLSSTEHSTALCLATSLVC